MNARSGRVMRWVAAALGLALAMPAAGQTTRTWNCPTATGDWFTASNWTPAPSGNGPDAGDTVWITNKTVLLTNDTPALASVILTNAATLVFSNWNTRLIASNVAIHATVTHVANTDTNGTDGWQTNANVYVVCTNLTVGSGGSIDGNGKGYQGNPALVSGGGPGYGPGYGGKCAGGGHGAAGGDSPGNGVGGVAYDDAAAPVMPGSSGGWHDAGRPGGHGGGAVRIAASGDVRLDGAISVNGLAGGTFSYGGGSGGSVFITCRTLAGSGRIRADGGDGETTRGGGGAGGRIALDYSVADQAALGIQPTVTFSLKPGSYTQVKPNLSDPGTLWLRGTNFFPSVLISNSCSLIVPGFTNFALGSLTIDSAWVQFPTGVVIDVAGGTTVKGSGSTRLVVDRYARLKVGGDLLLTNGAALHVYAGATNSVGPVYGARVDVSGTLRVAANSVVYPYSHSTNCGSVFFSVGNLSVAASGKFDANGLGGEGGVPNYGNGQSPGSGGGKGGSNAGGGGYGGKGGDGSGGAGGTPYGSSNAPAMPGSGGGARDAGRPGGDGGGLIWVDASGGIVTLDGALNANGSDNGGYGAGGGSGGGIYVLCRTFAGSGGGMQAKGGVGSGGGGGGGRIAVARAYDTSSGITATVTPGSGSAGGATGTVVRIALGPTITNVTATAITETNAWIVGNLVSTGEAPCDVYAYWGLTNGSQTKSAWDTNAFVGNSPVGLVSNQLSGLTLGTLYHYRFYASNVFGDAWATNAGSFSTLGGLAVNNGGGATAVGQTVATLHGIVTAGNPTPSAYIAWGDNDGEDAGTSAWDRVEFGGVLIGSYSVTVSNLLANKIYYYRAYVDNGASAFAPATTNFTTQSPVLTINDVSVLEGAVSTTTDAVFTVSLSAESAVPVTVDFATSNGTAAAGADYIATNGTLTIPAGNLSGTISVRLIGDNTDEFPSEALYLNLDNPSQATLADSQGLCTILDDDDVAETRTWTGTGNWNSDSNWAPWGRPSPADTVIMGPGSVMLSNAVQVAAVVVSNAATLIFTNWDTTLTAVDVEVRSNGVVTHAANTDTNSAGGWTPDARVSIVCTNLSVLAGGNISADGQGYRGDPGAVAPWTGCGPGGGSDTAGGGYGGRGTRGDGIAGGGTYGSESAPSDHGSGGGSGRELTRPGGQGGGAVRISASGSVAVNGVVSANGTAGAVSLAGGGSGGAVHIACRTFSGAGRISANGGNASGSDAGGGGGGRISITYDPTAQAGVSPAPNPILSAAPGSFDGRVGEPGTVYLTDACFYPYAILTNSARIRIPAFTNWAPAALSVRNAYVWLPTGLTVHVGGDIVVDGGFASRLVVDAHSVLHADGHLTLTNGGALHVYSGPTNDASWKNYGALIEACGTLCIGSNSWVYPVSEGTNGGSPKFTAGSVTVASGAGFDANARGFKGGVPNYGNGQGPGGGQGNSGVAGGGGYGGRGADGSPGTGGSAYGSSNAPAMPGSGGGARDAGRPGGDGGGLIWIDAADVVMLNGTLRANGSDGVWFNAGGGSGGGIYLRCRVFAGTGGSLRANAGGGSGTTGPGGGGGRIAVWRARDTSAGVTAAVEPGGGSATGEPGTMVWGKLGLPGTIIMIR